MTQDEVIKELHNVIAGNQNYTTWTVSTPHLVELVNRAIKAERAEPLIGCVNHDCAKCKERTWVDLTDEDIKSVRQTFPLGGIDDFHFFAKAVLAKLKEKNNA